MVSFDKCVLQPKKRENLWFSTDFEKIIEQEPWVINGDYHVRFKTPQGVVHGIEDRSNNFMNFYNDSWNWIYVRGCTGLVDLGEIYAFRTNRSQRLEVNDFFRRDGTRAFPKNINVQHVERLSEHYLQGQMTYGPHQRYFSAAGMIFADKQGMLAYDALNTDERALLSSCSREFYEFVSLNGASESDEEEQILSEWTKTAIQCLKEGTLETFLESCKQCADEGIFSYGAQIITERGAYGS